jgi:hypothetical protein
MTLVAVGVFGLIQLGLVLCIAGAVTRSRAVLLIGVLVLLVGLALFLGIRSACAGDGC